MSNGGSHADDPASGYAIPGTICFYFPAGTLPTMYCVKSAATQKTSKAHLVTGNPLQLDAGNYKITFQPAPRYRFVPPKVYFTVADGCETAIHIWP